MGAQDLYVLYTPCRWWGLPRPQKGQHLEEGSMMSYSRYPQSVSPYQSTEKKSRCGGNG